MRESVQLRGVLMVESALPPWMSLCTASPPTAKFVRANPIAHARIGRVLVAPETVVASHGLPAGPVTIHVDRPSRLVARVGDFAVKADERPQIVPADPAVRLLGGDLGATATTDQIRAVEAVEASKVSSSRLAGGDEAHLGWRHEVMSVQANAQKWCWLRQLADVRSYPWTSLECLADGPDRESGTTDDT